MKFLQNNHGKARFRRDLKIQNRFIASIFNSLRRILSLHNMSRLFLAHPTRERLIDLRYHLILDGRRR